MEKYWISVPGWTAQVSVENGIIVKVPPILKMFKGKPFESLLIFVKKAKGFKLAEL